MLHHCRKCSALLVHCGGTWPSNDPATGPRHCYLCNVLHWRRLRGSRRVHRGATKDPDLLHHNRGHEQLQSAGQHRARHGQRSACARVPFIGRLAALDRILLLNDGARRHPALLH